MTGREILEAAREEALKQATEGIRQAVRELPPTLSLEQRKQTIVMLKAGREVWVKWYIEGARFALREVKKIRERGKEGKAVVIAPAEKIT